jgi:hypothetical protein
MDRNLYLELLLKGLDSANGINVDSIETLLTNMTDLHNTIGKSYEFLVDVISGLMKNVNTNKTDESSAKKIKEHTAQIEDLKERIRDLENELERSRQTIQELEYENQLKDSTLQDMKGVLNKIDRVTSPQPQSQKQQITTVTVIPPKENSSNKNSAPRKLEDLMPSLSPPTDFSFLRQSLEKEQQLQIQQLQQRQPSPKIEIKMPDIFDDDDDEDSGPSKLKRKYDEFSKPAMPMMNIEEGDENSKSSSTGHHNKIEDSEGNMGDDFKFKKVFKKVKRSENNSKSHTGPSNSTSTPHQPLITYNSKHKPESFTPKPSLTFDEDNSLHNLLNNFVDKENSKDKVYSKSNITKKKDSNTKSNRFADDQRLEPKASLSDSEAYETGNSSKIFKKTNEIFNFSQKSPLKSFDLPVDTTNIRSIPITRNGRVSIKSDNSTVNLMQKMLNGHQKRTSGETQNMFRMSTQSSVDKKKSNDKSDDDILKPLSAFNDEDLVRAPYRTKAERENLQGYDCDQFL